MEKRKKRGERGTGPTPECRVARLIPGLLVPQVEVSKTGSAKTVSGIDVPRIDDAGSILKSCIGFCLRFSAMASQLRPISLGCFRGIQAIETNFRIGFLSSVGRRLPYPCLPPPCPILRSRAPASFPTKFSQIMLMFGQFQLGRQRPKGYLQKRYP